MKPYYVCVMYVLLIVKKERHTDKTVAGGEEGDVLCVEWESLGCAGLRDKFWICDSNNPRSYRLMYCEIQRWPPIGHVA